MAVTAKVIKKGPGLAGALPQHAAIRTSEVFVGIPANQKQRRRGAITNASLLFIHTHGSPLRFSRHRIGEGPLSSLSL